MKIKLFEAFAGYGSQRMALRNIGIDFESVGISEIEGDVLLSYASIHTDFLKQKKEIDSYVLQNRSQMIEYLESINVPLDYKTFKNRAKKLKDDKLKEMYLANKLSKNFGDIRIINPKTLPDIDFFTYSFPCQDISVAGYQNGLDEKSGTRSSLLWECCKIIEEKKPKYLMMENVKNLVGCNHRHNFERFLNYLNSLGYKSTWKVLNAKDYGVPQSRERVFCISVYNEALNFEFPTPVDLNFRLHDALEEKVDNSFYLRNNQVLKEPIEQEICYCLDSNYWKGVTLKSFLEKRRRQLVTDKKCDDKNNFIPRRLTPRETWRLMGVSDNDFSKANQVNSGTSLYRQSGILPRDRNYNNILAFKQSILCSKDLVRVDSVYRSEFETLIDIVSVDNIELWKLFCDISIDLLLIKDLIIQESKAFIANRVKDNISKISDKLSLNYDLTTLQLPYALRMATTLLSFAVTGIERESSFIISNSNDIVKRIKSKIILMRDQYGINVANIYSLIINESVNQSIKSDAGSSYETRFNEMISPIVDSISGHCHDKNIKSVEYDFVFKINDIKIGVSAKRTLRERYKQNFEDVSGLDVDYMLLATLGTDLNEEKLNNILQRNHIYVLVADEVYKSRGFMQKTNMVISSDNISREKFESIFVKY